RPQFRNISPVDLMNYRLPMAGKVSILHRVSGALLFLCLPILIAMFAMSFVSESGFNAMSVVIGHPIVKLILLVLIWGYLHHFCAGIRYLVLDLHIGMDKESAAKSASMVLGVSLALTVVFGLKLFGVW
ncbi:MAG: succinate dehydrogenase, cytochrome b556 subunit, partial [Sheuella sp.]|nr:succinate dehydrogenase, cytochrome b556 subunit [Sheuella sp.]